MRAIRKKTESRRGASITFALLLFLVCAVLSSVIIVAATTAAGRISRLAESDQRYYAVTSAAEFIKDMVEGKPASVVEEIVTTTRCSYRDDVEEGREELSTVSRFFMPEVGSVYNNSDEVPSPGSKHLSSIVGDAAYRYVLQNQSKLGTGATRTLEIGFPAAQSRLSAKVEETLYANGRIQMLVSNTEGDPFVLQLWFVPIIDEMVEQLLPVEGEKQNVADDNGTETYTIDRTETLVKTTTLSWKLERVKTGYN